MRLSPLIHPSRVGNLGILQLNNPKALNALTLGMIECMQDVLADWHMDDSLKAILVTCGGSDTKRPAFCVGGDVKSVYQDAISGGTQGLTSKFFREEYKVNYAIRTWNRPQISLWNGAVMGGGAGISIHGEYRVATENTLFAMPETALGFFPDVGSCWWMSHLLMPGMARFLALTGARLNAPDLLYSGIATHYVPSNKLDELQDALAHATAQEGTGTAPDLVGPVLRDFHEAPATPPDDSFLARHARSIDAAFTSPDSVEEILINLANQDTEFSKEALILMNNASPTSLKVTFEGLKRGGYTASIGEDLQMEYRMSQAFMKEGSDFYRGVRATLIDKDGKPEWSPARLEDVTKDMVESYFAPLGEDEWQIPTGDASGDVIDL
jgi:enoyl-CoA hydratase/carnithine racemase